MNRIGDLRVIEAMNGYVVMESNYSAGSGLPLPSQSWVFMDNGDLAEFMAEYYSMKVNHQPKHLKEQAVEK